MCSRFICFLYLTKKFILQALRNEQRSYASKINELQSDLAEHKIVIENLEKVDGDRKCYRWELLFRHVDMIHRILFIFIC